MGIGEALGSGGIDFGKVFENLRGHFAFVTVMATDDLNLIQLKVLGGKR